MKSAIEAMRKGIFVFLPLFLLPLTFGDGVAISLKDLHGWSFVDETSQVAFINQEKGIEKLIISITTKGSEKNIYWLFPIPSSPEKVNFQILYGLPDFYGKEVTDEALEKLESSTAYLYLNQIYTLPFFLYLYTVSKVKEGVSVLGGLPFGKAPGVTVYEHIDKGGAIAEKVTAKDANSLYDYLKSKGLHITKGAIPVLDYYIGKDYTFIITWLKSSFYKEKERARAIYVKFPSPKIYYPLYPTSIYGRKEIPISIFITRFHSVQLFPEVKDYASIEYLIGEYYEPWRLSASEIQPIREFLGGKKSDECTKISIDAPASTFASDLWINPHPAPLGVRYAKFIAKHPSFTSLLILIIASCVAGYLIGLILFPFLRKEPFPLLALGFANVFTLLAVIISVASLHTNEERKDMRQTIETLRKKEYLAKRYTSVLLFGLASVFGAIALGLLSAVLSEHSYIDPALVTWTVLFGLGSIASLWGGISLSRVYEEDRGLLNELKEAGYSTWFFCPIDRAKLVFVFLFSLSYLFLVWFLKTLIALPLRFS
jgi:hypothetical protein